jgi:hypothetical protein
MRLSAVSRMHIAFQYVRCIFGQDRWRQVDVTPVTPNFGDVMDLDVLAAIRLESQTEVAHCRMQ